MAKKGGCKGLFVLVSWIFLIFTFLWILNSLGVMTWNIPWMPITFFIIAVGMMLKIAMYKAMKK